MSKPKKTKTFNVTLKVTPTSGDPTSRPIQVKSPTVSDVLAAGGVTHTDKNLVVNGEPADLNTPIAEGDVVGVEERVAGS